MALKIGSTGDNVKKLQEKLGLKADGEFGPVTEIKIKEWQSANGLTPDGIFGEVSWQKMFGEPMPKLSNLFKLENLIGHIPMSVIEQIPDTAKKFNITTPLRLAMWT